MHQRPKKNKAQVVREKRGTARQVASYIPSDVLIVGGYAVPARGNAAGVAGEHRRRKFGGHRVTKPELLKQRYLPRGQEENPAVEDESSRRISGTEKLYESGEKESL